MANKHSYYLRIIKIVQLEARLEARVLYKQSQSVLDRVSCIDLDDGTYFLPAKHLGSRYLCACVHGKQPLIMDGWH